MLVEEEVATPFRALFWQAPPRSGLETCLQASQSGAGRMAQVREIREHLETAATTTKETM